MLRGSAPRTPPAGNDRERSEKTRSRLHPFARLLPSPASHPRGRQRAMAFDAGLPVLRLACSQAQFVQERAWHGGGSAGSGYRVCWGHRQWGRRRRLPSGRTDSLRRRTRKAEGSRSTPRCRGFGELPESSARDPTDKIFGRRGPIKA